MNNNYLKISLVILLACSGIYTKSLFANEWANGADDRNGFSEFAPPVPFSHKDKKHKYEWRSGSSFKAFNKEQYVDSRVARNPWKPVSKFSKKQTFSGQRPWGNIPERKPGKANNMRFHDQRFKQWLSRGDSLRNNYSYPQPSSGYMENHLMYPGAYSRGYVPGGYVPFVANSPVLYGVYPGAYSPYGGLTNRPWNW